MSIGLGGSLKGKRGARVHGASSAGDALGQALRDTGLRAVEVGPRAFRIEPAPVASAAPGRPPPAIVDQRPIIVTALRQPRNLADVPARIVIIRPDVGGGLLPDSQSLVRQDAALSASNAGTGTDRLFIRGVGDAPLGGFGQQSVALLIDDARLTFDGPDPDLALIDVDRVEILEGPQGPLYGTGALGGIVRIVPANPDLVTRGGTIAAGPSTTAEGDVGGGGLIIANLPLATGKSALRLVAYGERAPGWIDNDGGRHDSNHALLVGGRASLRVRTHGGWTIDTRLVAQVRNIADSRYVDGALGNYIRPDRRREPIDTDFLSGAVVVHGNVAGADVDSTTSISLNDVERQFARALGSAGPDPIRDDRTYRLIDQELRISGSGRIDWLAGASLISARTKATIGADGEPPLLRFNRSVSEVALYGQVGTTVVRGVDASAGLRGFVDRVHDESAGAPGAEARAFSFFRLTPSASLDWRITPRLSAYVRLSSAYRPGGVGIGEIADPTREHAFTGDRLDGAEAGVRWDRGAFHLDATAFASIWRSVQADFLLDSGLVATRNVGDAMNVGIEGSAKLAVAGMEIGAGFLVQRSRLEMIAGSNPAFDDRRLPLVPDASLRLDVSKAMMLGGWRGTARAGVSIQDATRLSFDPALDRRMPARLTADAGIELSRGPWTIAATGTNLTGTAVDSYAFGNPYLLSVGPQRTPLKPRGLSLSLSRRF